MESDLLTDLNSEKSDILFQNSKGQVFNSRLAPLGLMRGVLRNIEKKAPKQNTLGSNRDVGHKDQSQSFFLLI